MTPEDEAEYLAEVREWDVTLADGLDLDDPTQDDMLAAIDGLFASAMAAYMILGNHLMSLYATMPDDNDDDTMPCGCSRVIRNAMVCGGIKAGANPFVVYDGPDCACACHRVIESEGSNESGREATTNDTARYGKH